MTIWNEQAMLAEVAYRQEQMLRSSRRRQGRGASTRRAQKASRNEVPRRRWSLRGSEAWHVAR